MKKHKTFILVLAAVSVLFTLTGCQLAKEDMKEEKTKDSLIGVFITDEYLDLFDMKGYLEDHMDSFSNQPIQVEDNSGKYKERLYAVLKDTEQLDEETSEKRSIKEYAFEDIEGLFLIAPNMHSDKGDDYITSNFSEGVSDAHFGTYFGDEENKVTLDATIYLASGMNQKAQYVNPVYQSSDGSVYALSGQGISVVDDTQSGGGEISQKLEESLTVTENGKSKKKTTIINLSIKNAQSPEKIAVILMDHNNCILSREEYEPGKLPKAITPNKKTDYIILETYSIDLDGAEKITRTFYTKDDLNLQSFVKLENNILAKKDTSIQWYNKN